MPIVITCLLDRPAPSETFIRRELDQLRQRGWPLKVCMLQGGEAPLRRLTPACEGAIRRRIARRALARASEELLRAPLVALRLLARLPQAADLAGRAAASESRLLHAHFAGITADLTGIAAAALGLPWTCAVHARDVFVVPPDQTGRRLRQARSIVACSQLAADAVIASGVPASRVKMIRHGLALEQYPFRQPGPVDTPDIFTACRLEPKKGMDTLLRACARLRDQGARFTCSIAGTGQLDASLRRLARSLNLDSTLRFEGWLSEEAIRARVAAAAVLALPSRRTPDGDRDGMANIVVEAMALGTPVVTTSAGAAAEVIVDGEHGLLTPPDDPDRLADALAALLASVPLRARLAASARRQAEACFDSAATLRQLEAFLTAAAQP